MTVLQLLLVCYNCKACVTMAMIVPYCDISHMINASLFPNFRHPLLETIQLFVDKTQANTVTIQKFDFQLVKGLSNIRYFMHFQCIWSWVGKAVTRHPLHLRIRGLPLQGYTTSKSHKLNVPRVQIGKEKAIEKELVQILIIVGSAVEMQEKLH